MNPDASPVLLLAPLYSFTTDADAASVENALELVLLLVQSSVEVRKAMLYGAAGASQFAPPLLLPPEVRSMQSSVRALTRMAARIRTPLGSSARSAQPAHTPRATALCHASRPASAPATSGPWRRGGQQDPTESLARTAETPRPLARRTRARVQSPLHRPRGLPGQRVSVCLHIHTHHFVASRTQHCCSALQGLITPHLVFIGDILHTGLQNGTHSLNERVVEFINVIITRTIVDEPPGHAH